MNKKSIEDKFSIDMDAYFNDIENVDKPQNDEYNKILNLGKALANKDFSKNSNKEAVFNRTLKNINENKENNVVKGSNKIKRIAVAAACCLIICGALSQTSFAKGVLEKVISTVFIGDNGTKIMQEKEPPKADKNASRPIPDKLKGKVFDKNGKPITNFTDGTQFYTANGEKITGFASSSKDPNNVTIQTEKSRKEKTLIVKDSSKLDQYTCFKVKLPSYLPKDYKFDRAEFIKNKDGEVSNQYIFIFFTNKKTGKEIFMPQRVSNNDTKFVSSTDGKLEKVKVNGKDAAIIDDRYIDWEYDNVLYEVSGKGTFGKDELIKIAESVK